MEKKYLNDDLSKYVKEDIETIYKARVEHLKDPDDKIKYYLLKKSIYDLCIDMKAEVVTGELKQSKADEMKEYFWGLIL